MNAPTPSNVVRFPRTSLMLEAQGIADAFRQAATDLEELAGTAHAYEPGTLRRKIRAITLAAVASAVDCEGK
jgi:hypothetical protein